MCPHPLVPGVGTHSLAREGLGESHFRRGDIHCGTLYIHVLCGIYAQHQREAKTAQDRSALFILMFSGDPLLCMLSCTPILAFNVLLILIVREVIFYAGKIQYLISDF